MSKIAETLIGTSGFNYKDWKGPFYPPGLPQREWLRHYAQNFPTVELNVTFYRFPRAEMVENWASQVPRTFRFAVKLWRGITHYRKLKDCRKFTRNFAEALDVLPVRQRAAILIQLPNMTKNVERLKNYLGELKEFTGGKWKIAVEFRNQEWLTDEIYRLLDHERAAICLHDMKDSATTKPNKARFVYVRRHGSGAGKYQGGYAPEQIGSDAAQIRQWQGEGRPVYVYYNNDVHGHAVHDAWQLNDALKLE